MFGTREGAALRARLDEGTIGAPTYWVQRLNWWTLAPELLRVEASQLGALWEVAELRAEPLYVRTDALLVVA